MKRILLGIAVVVCLAAGCSKDETPAPVMEKRTYADKKLASMEEKTIYTELGASLGTTRTTLSGFKVLWSLNDILSVWSDESNMPVDYIIYKGIDTSTGKFRTTDATKGVSGTRFYAVYPSSLVTGPGTLMLPVEQTYLEPANFSTNTAPMAAVSEDMMNMSFENLCGILVVDLSGNGLIVNDIQLQSYDQALAGTATIDFSGAAPQLTCTGTSALTLNCGNVALADTPKAFYIVVPAGKYEQGIDITINAYSRTAGAMTFKKSRKSSFTINAGTVTRIGARFVLDATTYKVGDLYDAGGKKGVVFDVDATGRSGKILALDDCSVGGTAVTDCYGTYYYYTWGPANPTAVVIDKTDGSVNMSGVAAVGIDSYPAFKAAAALGDGWYIPAEGEIQAVIDACVACPQYGGSEMWGVAYWCSNMASSGRTKSIRYYDAAEDGVVKGVAVAKQSTIMGSVRAIAAF